MTAKVVAMPLIPRAIRRGSEVRCDLSYARYGVASWQWWCARHGVEFVVLSEAADNSFRDMPPTFQRWLAPEKIIRSRGRDTRVALVDADTMIRWDAPDFFGLAGSGFAAARGSSTGWIGRSVRAFQPLFPVVSMPLSSYLNVGVAVVGEAQLGVLRSFLDFSGVHWPEIEKTILSGPFGTDQTPLNFMLRSESAEVRFLPPAFNLLHCFPMDPTLRAIDKSPSPDLDLFAARAFIQPGCFQFVNAGYIWHFNNVVAARPVAMRETWRRVAHHYPGADDAVQIHP